MHHLPSPASSGGSHGATLAEGNHGGHAAHQQSAYSAAYGYATDRVQEFWDRLRGKGRRPVGWLESGRNIVLSSSLNVLLLFIPFAWASHWEIAQWGKDTTFALCFLAIIPLECMFDWGGEQMALYLGKDLGDLLIITLNNAVEAVLAIILLVKCELRLLQSTIVGVVILHLLLIPGTAFLVGGYNIRQQTLHPHSTDLNHSLLMVGVLATLLPTAFFAALDRGASAVTAAGTEAGSALVNDATRGEILKMSRGIALMLLTVYIASRIYMHNPPGENNALTVPHDAPAPIQHEEKELLEEEPLVNPWACMILLAVTVALMAVTAEFLVESIDAVRETSGIQEEWFGLILLPIVSFSADGAVAILFFFQSIYNHITHKKNLVPSMLARGRAIDLSIQFTLWWMPVVVLLGWWTSRPMHLLFDYLEVALLLGSCFLVNYVTADSKTNWVEGLIMVVFYFMIALVTWFYPGQPEVAFMLNCEGTVAEALAAGGEGGAEAAASEAAALLARMF
ncbi:hypothetical protein BV20DRAFT_999784 [Pilatotrama ljubarskyi]|nr:hypothetical protein BV20DRAFT_999784 [Pilatotrama ljubarskyi]